MNKLSMCVCFCVCICVYCIIKLTLLWWLYSQNKTHQNTKKKLQQQKNNPNELNETVCIHEQKKNTSERSCIDAL